MTGCAILDGSIAARKNGKRLPCEVLLAENAKLRELVGELMPTARIAAQHGINVGKLADQERRARDLGVEVDDG